jgi:hypothetical protein
MKEGQGKRKTKKEVLIVKTLYAGKMFFLTWPFP